MMQVLTPEEGIESREKFLDNLEEALLGDPANWRNGFPDNLKLYHALLGVFELWEEGEKTYVELETVEEKSCGCL